jgi:predicted O-methyltransferase YrrM
LELTTDHWELRMTDRLITSAEIDSYIDLLLPERDDVLREMEEVARQREIPIIGPAVGRYLHLLALSIGAKRIFEAGSAIGYSTIWLARAVGPGGKVVYSDGDRRNADQARRYFERAGVLDRIDVRVGDALELLSEEKAPFDLIFNDVDKEDYPRMLRLALPRLRVGGLFVADNALWHGRVLDESPDAHTKGVLEFNRLLYSTPQLYPAIVPLRDGVAVAIKTS